MANADEGDIATRIAAATAARRRRPDYPSEVRALLDAARVVIARTGRARVADIIAEAGLSTDAFYRHFESKDALVAAMVEDGTERIAAAAARRMADEDSAEAEVRCWLDAMLAQTDPSKAGATVAVLRATTNSNTGIPTGDHHSRLPLARLLHDPFAALGSTDPVLDAQLVTHAVMSLVSGHLWAGTVPSSHEHQHLIQFCLTVPHTG